MTHKNDKASNSIVKATTMLLLISLCFSVIGCSQGKKVDRLIADLDDEDLVVRMNAVETLGEIGDVRAVEPLIDALKDWNLQDEATLALKRLGSVAAESVISALEGKDAAVRACAAQILGHMLQEGTVDVALARRLEEARVIELLIVAVEDEDADVRTWATWALGVSQDARAVEPLIAALKDEDVVVRKQAAFHLGWQGDARAVDPLVAALLDEDSTVRHKAAESLVQIGSPAVDPLIDALNTRKLDVIAETYLFFIERGGFRMEEILIEALHIYGTEQMAREYLHSGNTQLAEAAEKWARSHGYEVIWTTD